MSIAESEARKMSLWCLRRSKIECFQVTFKRGDRWRKSNEQWYRVQNGWCRHAEGAFTNGCSCGWLNKEGLV